ncbi:MAG TPA: hypothetical protein VGR32_08740 [Brevundimonas sp.]|nr:hypothetical protein [Brevundimonas sp.]
MEFIGEPSPGVFEWLYTVGIGPESSLFRSSGSTLMSAEEGDGSTLEYVSPSSYVHTARDGTVRTFSTSMAYPPAGPPGISPPAGDGGRIVQLVKPNGEQWDWYYRSAAYGTNLPVYRIQSVTSTLGYQIKFEYAYNATPTSDAELLAFRTLAKTIGINNAVDWCDPTADTCGNLSQSWPQVQYAAVPGGYSVTNLLNETTKYIFSGGGLAILDFPEPGRSDITLTYTYFDEEPRVETYSDGRGTWLYQYSHPSPAFRWVTVTDPNSAQTQYRTRIRFGPAPGPMGATNGCSASAR